MTGEDATERFRLFVAITVPAAIREELVRIPRELEPLVPVGVVRWTKPEQFHLTLRFLGDVPSNQLSELHASVRTACAGAPALPLCAQGVGFFPNARAPRIIWAGVSDRGNRLLNFQRKIESALEPYAVGQGEERFAGHITLGRFKQYNRFNTNKLASYAESIKNRVFGEWTVQEIEIIRSELSRTGAQYTSLAACLLEAGIGSP